MFPLSDISGDLSLGINDNVADLYNCSSLNFEPFTFTDNKGYFITDNADPDDNFYKHIMSTNSLYYTEEQFKHQFPVSKEESTNFSIIHFKCRSSYNKL